MIDRQIFAVHDFFFDGNIDGNCLLPSVIARAEVIYGKVELFEKDFELVVSLTLSILTKIILEVYKLFL